MKQLSDYEYYRTELGVLYCGDCLEILPLISEFDLCITSPPYDNLRDYNGYSFDFENIAKELYNKANKGSVVVWVVGDATINGSETGTSFKQALYFKELGFNLHDTMIYQKIGCPFPEINRYYPIFEYMFVLSKNKIKTVNLIADRMNKYVGNKIARKHHSRNKDGTVVENTAYKNNKEKVIKKNGVRFNIWKIVPSRNKNTGMGNHPAIFPEQLASDHIESWSNKGDLVLDCFMGSGTTAKMCEKLNRRWIGIEISEEYCEIAKKRIKAEVDQLKLFK